ncbi:hypothetical protein CKO25_03625 [Thiocapsa imhoffii]|uniref:Uncharacterized protein n=1 Tax=Thiocapsa imhoffii TaxID=382777 RepID=A0A9X0WFQ8_9GAMM|nr:hypothetical protein [Thiocapsa imhoffii]MBK1643763.1 hypothetical protein [Thiocapsa imhoffii]
MPALNLTKRATDWRHLPPSARERIGDLTPGEALFLLQDLQNPNDPSALLMRTADPLSILGYC